jgi:hypothetical protein
MIERDKMKTREANRQNPSGFCSDICVFSGKEN